MASIPQCRWTSARKRVGKLRYSWQKWSNAVVGQFRPAPCFFILTPKNVTSETPISLLSALSRWWEWLRAPVIQRMEEKNWSETGCCRLEQWRTTKNSLGDIVGHWSAYFRCFRNGSGSRYFGRRFSQSLRTSTADSCGHGQCSSASRNEFIEYFAGTFSTNEG